jgi:hypothetical protein
LLVVTVVADRPFACQNYSFSFVGRPCFQTMAGYNGSPSVKLYTLPVVRDWPADRHFACQIYYFCEETVLPINGRLLLIIYFAGGQRVAGGPALSRRTGIWPADRHWAALPKFVIRHFLLLYKTFYVNRQIAGGTTFECRWPVHQRPTYILSQTRGANLYSFFIRGFMYSLNPNRSTQCDRS